MNSNVIIDYQGYINLYANILQLAFPLAFVFGIGNAIVGMVYAAAFGGRLRIGSGGGRNV